MSHEKKKILIIRSASFQQLDKNLPDLVKMFPEYQFDLLTHVHGRKLAEKYEHIDEIIEYRYNGSFQSKHKVKELVNVRYEKVIVLVTNISGSGFWNVIQFAFTIEAKEYLQCNMNSSIKKLTRKGLFQDTVIKGLQKTIAIVTTVLSSIVIIPFLIVNWARIKKR